MKKLLLIILGASLALLAGCATDSGGSSDNGYIVLQQGSHSGLKDQVEKQIHNQADLNATWNDIYANQSSKAPLPTVDFAKTTILVYGTGEMKHGGYTVRVDHANATASGYEVGFTVNEPGNNCSRTTNEMTYPFIVVSVPTAGDVTFAEVKTHQIPPCT